MSDYMIKQTQELHRESKYKKREDKYNKSNFKQKLAVIRY